MRPEQRDLRRVTLGAAIIFVFLICIMDSPRVHPQSGPLPLGVPPQSAAEKSGKAWQTAKEAKDKSASKKAWAGKSEGEKAAKVQAAKAAKEKAAKEKAEKSAARAQKEKDKATMQGNKDANTGQGANASRADGGDGQTKKLRCPAGQILDRRSKGCL